MAKDTDKKLDEALNKMLVGDKDFVAEVEDDEELELSDIDKAKLEAEAKKEVAADLKKQREKEFKEAAKQRLKKQLLFQNGKDEKGENLEPVLVTLASHTPFLLIDGRRYYNGKVYNLGKGLAAVIKEQMYRGELHSNEIAGKNMKEFYGQRPQGLRIGNNTPLPAGIM